MLPISTEEDNDFEATKHAIPRRLLLKQSISFFMFGLINNVLYVIILSAALDLVPPSTPKGIIAFCNIFPALIAKLAWPYLLKGKIRYARRMSSCCGLSVLGMIVVAMFDSLSMRLLGISLASFASGLGELTFLQLSTVYHPASVAGSSVSSFASGTGAAGLVGAFMWWELRGLGVRTGVGISAVLPFVIPVMYHLVLAPPSVFCEFEDSASVSDGDGATYQAVPTTQPDQDHDMGDSRTPTVAESSASRLASTINISTQEKWTLAKPLLLQYMLPLFCVYTFEYTINQGVSPTLVFPVPASSSTHPILGRLIHSIRDYYPLWQLVYQSTVFLSRSSISLGLPPLPQSLLSLPAIIQAGILGTLAAESSFGIFGDTLEHYSFAVTLIFVLISIEGICGGLAYVNVFYHINQRAPKSKASDSASAERARQEKEFEIGSIGLADSTGILFAAIIAVPVEVGLCRLQVNRGREICAGL